MVIHVLTKSGFFVFSQLRLFPAPIKAAHRFNTMSLGPIAGFGEHDLALGGDRFAEQDPAGAADEPPERLLPLFERAQPLIVALETKKGRIPQAKLAPRRAWS